MKGMLTPDMVGAYKVRFLKPIYEDDFVEKGMIAYLTDITWESKEECYKLWFDFFEFESVNRKYFKEVFYSNKHTKAIMDSTGRKLFTALETMNYSPKYSVYFSISSGDRDDDLLDKELSKYIMVMYH